MEEDTHANRVRTSLNQWQVIEDTDEEASIAAHQGLVYLPTPWMETGPRAAVGMHIYFYLGQTHDPVQYR